MAYKTARKLVVAAMGVTVVLFGVILIFTPGPALVFIPLGLAILGLEFAWARKWLRFIKDRSATIASNLQKSKSKSKPGNTVS